MRPVGNYRTLMYDTPRRRLSVHKKPHRTGGRQEKSRAVPRRGMRGARLNNEIVTLCNALINPCICRKWAFSLQRVCALIPAWRGMGPLGWSPLLCEGQGRIALRHRTRDMQHLLCGLPRIHLLRGWVNKSPVDVPVSARWHHKWC